MQRHVSDFSDLYICKQKPLHLLQFMAGWVFMRRFRLVLVPCDYGLFWKALYEIQTKVQSQPSSSMYIASAHCTAPPTQDYTLMHGAKNGTVPNVSVYTRKIIDWKHKK